MKLNRIINNTDLQVYKNFLIERIRADETPVGKLMKVVGYVMIALSLYDYGITGGREFLDMYITPFFFGLGVASSLYGHFSQNDRIRKHVVFKDKSAPVKIDYFLKSINEKCEADGTFLFKYHNGDSFGTFPEGRFTMIRSFDTNGTIMHDENFYNQEMSLYAEAYKLMNKQGFAIVDSEHCPPELKFMLEREGIKRLVLVPVKEPLGEHSTGLVGIRFSETVSFSHEDIAWLMQKAKDATGIMTNIKIKKLV